MSYEPTDLSVNPATLDWAEADERTLTFDGDPDDDETVTGATAELAWLDTGADDGAGVAGGAVTGSITALSLSAEVASVTVADLTRAVRWYELRVTFTTSANTWTRTVGIEVVA